MLQCTETHAQNSSETLLSACHCGTSTTTKTRGDVPGNTTLQIPLIVAPLTASNPPHTWQMCVILQKQEILLLAYLDGLMNTGGVYDVVHVLHPGLTLY